jgi:ABC-type sugar transport system substrate-binding protein
MKKWLLTIYLLIGGFLFTACSNRDLKVCHIGVSQCSDDEWRHKMNSEMLREALFYDGLEVEIRSAKDNNQKQIADIQYFIDKEVDLLIVAPNEAAAITPSVEMAYKKGIPVIMVDRKIESDKYTAFIGADNYKIGQDAGNYILNMRKSSAKILEIRGLEGSTPAFERHKGLMDVIQDASNIQVV